MHSVVLVFACVAKHAHVDFVGQPRALLPIMVALRILLHTLPQPGMTCCHCASSAASPAPKSGNTKNGNGNGDASSDIDAEPIEDDPGLEPEPAPKTSTKPKNGGNGGSSTTKRNNKDLDDSSAPFNLPQVQPKKVPKCGKSAGG